MSQIENNNEEIAKENNDQEKAIIWDLEVWKRAEQAQFKAYLNAAFGDNVGSGKTYSKLSEIFTEEQAAYNVDELVALIGNCWMWCKR